MKRCPECRRDYYDDTLAFCLEDGTALLQGTVPSPDEPQTAIIHETSARAYVPATQQTAVLSSRAYEISKTSFDKRLIAALLALGIIALGGYFGYRYLRSADPERINSLAVLPFDNRSGSADADYLSDGLADSLIYRLSQLPNLKVSPTSSVMRYKGKETDVGRIAGELKVDALMSGRLVQHGDDLSISVQLIDARNEKVIWAEQYDRKMADLLATQREIATTITQKLQLKFSGDQVKGVTKKYTENNDAYQLYLKGRFHFAKRGTDDLLKSIEYYQRAIELDPNFALAFVGVSYSYSVGAANGNIPPDEAIPKARTAAHRALELDASLAEAHAALANSLSFDWNWAESEREYKRALELDPNAAEIHYRYALSYLTPMARTQEVVAEIKKALELEPLSLAIGSNLAGAYLRDRQYDIAVEQAEKTYNLDPNHPATRGWLVHVYAVTGRYEDPAHKFQ
jgi:TolB-like protein